MTGIVFARLSWRLCLYRAEPRVFLLYRVRGHVESISSDYTTRTLFHNNFVIGDTLKYNDEKHASFDWYMWELYNC